MRSRDHALFKFFYLKEQETAKKGGKKKGKKVVVQEAATAPVQNIDPTTSLPVEEMSAPYMAINSFSQILIVIFEAQTSFFKTIHGHQYIISIVSLNHVICRGQSQMMLLLISSSMDICFWRIAFGLVVMLYRLMTF